MDDVYDDTLVDFTYNFDESCMMDEPEGWNVLQTLLQNILEVFSKLEVSIDKSFQEVIQKNSSEEKQDLSKAERLLQTLKNNWFSKCKEAENLRVTLKQSTDESVRINNEYNEMKDNILNMRKQFGEAVDSSVSDIEELSIVNNSLTERVAELEAKIDGAEKYFKENITENLGAFLQTISISNVGVTNLTEWISKLKVEATKMNRMITAPDLFSTNYIDSNASLTHKSKKVVEIASQKLADSLKLELSDSRRIIDNQRSRLKDLESEKEELLQTQHCFINEISGDDMDETFDFLNTILSYKKASININTVPISSSQRNIQIVKRMLGNFNDNVTTLYEKTTTKCDEIGDLHETITYLTEQLKSMTVRTECLEDEFHVLKKNSEQTEINYQCSIDELRTTQKKLRRIEEERNMYLDENMELKNLSIQGHYGNVNNEHEKLLQRIKEIEMERDTLYDDLQEQIKKTNLCSSECKELEYKSEELENTISKLKRDYVDITREMSRVSHENEEIKKSVLDSERQRTVLKRDMKSLETSNKDLEDQLFHLTSENEKNKHDYEKITTSLQKYNTMVMELEEKLTICERDIVLIENDLKKERADKSDLEDSNKHLRAQLVIKDELEGVLREARTTMIRELEEKVITCEEGMKIFEKGIKKVKTDNNVDESNQQVKSQVYTKYEIEMLLRGAQKKDEELALANLDNKELENSTFQNDTVSISEPLSNSTLNEINQKNYILKREKKLRRKLENAQQKVDELFEYLRKRNENLKEAGQIIPNIRKDDILRRQSNERIDNEDSTIEQIAMECLAAKNVLQEENEYLQLMVNEVREELLKVQKGYITDENDNMNTPEITNELQSNKEVNTFSYVKNKVKKINEENERERMLSMTNIKSFKLNNRDIGDENIDIQGRIQKSEQVFDDMKPLIQQYRCNIIKELEDKLIQCERDKLIFESDLIRERNEKVNLQESYKSLDKSLKDGLSEKNKILLSGYEKLLMKLIDQRKEIITLLGFKKTEQFSNISLEISSSKGMEYKGQSEIEDKLHKCSYEVDSSFNDLALFLQTSKHNVEGIEHCYRDLSHFIGTTNGNYKETCYSTGDKLTEHSFSFEIVKSNTHYNHRHDIMQMLVEKVKDIVKHGNIVNRLLCDMKRKSRHSIKVIRRLKSRRKERKPNKIKKLFKLFKKIKRTRNHRIAYEKNFNPDDDATRSTTDHCLSLENHHINLNELSGSLTDAAEKLKEALISVNKCSDEEMEEVFCGDIQNADTSPIQISKAVSDSVHKLDSVSEKSEKLLIAQQDQRKYTVERLKFINKRFEVLLNCLKARATYKEDMTTSAFDYDCNCISDLLDGIRETFHPAEETMKGVVDVLQLAKDINMSDLDALQENKTINDDHLKIIVLIKKISEHRESKRESAAEKVNTIIDVDNRRSDKLMTDDDTDDVDIRTPGTLKSTSNTLKRENRLRSLLQGTQQRVDDLFGYLKQRNEDLKGKNELVENLYKEFEDFKEKVNLQNGMLDTNNERLFIVYDNIKSELEEENEVLQLIVEEIRDDLLNIQKEYTVEGKTNAYKKENAHKLQVIVDKPALLHEKEEVTKSVDDVERERMMLQRYINSVETSNKDLEDQLLYLTSENYKAKRDFAKTESLEEYNMMIQELKKVEHMNISEEDEIAFKIHLEKVRVDTMNLKESKDPLDWQLSVKDGLSEKSKILLAGYETLLTKLLHQRKETISILGLDETEEFKNIPLSINSSRNIEYKLASEIEDDIRKQNYKVDASFNALALYLQSSEDDWKRIETFYRELSYFLEKIDSQDKDSCYSTDSNGSTDGDVESDASPNWNDSRTFQYGFQSSKVNSKVCCKNMQRLVNKIKALGKHMNLIDEKLVEMKHKSKKSIKVIRHLQMKLKQRKTLDSNNRNKILHLSKKLKMSKVHHNAYHKKRGNNKYRYENDDNVSNLYLNTPFEHQKSNLKESSIVNGEPKLEDQNINECYDENIDERTSKNIQKVEGSSTTFNDIINKASTVSVDQLDSDTDDLQKTCLLYQEQKEYMIEHLKFTNKRLEHLLNCLKGNEVSKDVIRLSEIECNKNDKDITKITIDDPQLIKPIDITDELKLNKPVDKNHLEIIVMIMKMNQNMERILREDGSQASVTSNKSESTFTLVNLDDGICFEPVVTENISTHNVHVQTTNDIDTLKTDSKLKAILETTHQKIDDLSEYLTEREDDLKERGGIITNFHNEFEELKEKNDINASITERILIEYAKSKTMLEEENDFLQLFVKEVREELLNLEKGFKMEGETQMHLHGFISELQISKHSLEQNVDKITSELNVVKREKDYLLQSMSLAKMMNEYQGPCLGDPYSGGSMLRHNVQRMYDNKYYVDCGYCAHNSGSSVPPCSDEECPSTVSCDDCDSVISDQDIFEIICSPDSTTCSKLARNIKTSEATEKIKSKNHPLSCLEKEIKTRGSRRNSYSTSAPCVASLDTSTSIVNKEPRVLGRRDSVRSNNHGSSNSFRSNSGMFVHETGSITSQESITNIQGSLRHKKSYVDITAIDEYTILDEECNWNDTEISPFLNPKFDSSKKRKKKFLLFGRKWQK